MDPTVFGSAPHITSRPAVDESGLLCFEQQYTPDHRLKLITRGDCYIALQRLMVGDKLNAPMRFSTEHDLGYKIPFFVRYNTCAIGVASSKGLDDYFTLQLVSLVMMYIIRECVEHVDAKRYGGGHPVGWNRDLSAVVLGVTPEYEPPRRQYDAEVYRMLGPR
ncbi:hypothetical protein MMC11_000391 [Xylographa trunciseda]|nr:hypothetical protein [Xylographa trunciseda]